MLQFQRKKDTNILYAITQKDTNNSFLSSDQSKTMYDYILKHDSQINNINFEIQNLKSQLIELAMKSSFPPGSKNNNSCTYINNTENNNLFLSQIKKFKNEIKNELMLSINDMINSNIKKFEEKFENLKEEIDINDDKISIKKISEINNSLENINQKLLINNEEKNNLENIILNRVNNDKIEINNTTENIIKRIDNLDMDFDRLIISLKNQFLNSANTINQLQLSKVNINTYENQIEEIKHYIENINNKMENIINNNSGNYIKDFNFIKQNKNNIFNENNINKDKNIVPNDDDIEIKKELNVFKNDLYNDLEKINLKMLNELKNQADDIKLLYQEINYLKNKINTDTKLKSPNNQELNSSNNNLLNAIDNSIIIPNNMHSYLESELSKKANLDQLNFALEAQSKLNEAFSSATRMTRLCWDSDGELKDDKFIKWSIQNINTALDVFKWEQNSENIKILQNGVYKVVLGLIGLDYKKNIGIIFNNDENIVVDSNIYNTNNINNLYENEFNNNDKGNVQFMIKYIACIENTDIKAIIFSNNDKNNSNNSNDNSEEGFLEITKII